ncbi:MAG: hypothetical protein QNJ97_07935 [Myxococcota bacterium]|nr:hypothetical protein [Myxococcota bacterium]
MLYFRIIIPFLLLISGCLQRSSELFDGGLACTEIGCEDYLKITIEQDNGAAFPPGSYAFTFEPTGQQQIEISCTLDNALILSCTGAPNTLVLGLTPSALEFTVLFHYAPSAVGVDIRYNDRILALETVAPDYSIVTPNGPECEPTCLQASLIISVDPAMASVVRTKYIESVMETHYAYRAAMPTGMISGEHYR